MKGNFDICIVIENGYPHYKVIDKDTGSETHCDFNELNETIDELLMENLKGV